MVSVANVYAWGMYVGAVLWDDSKGVAAFEYNPAFCRKGIELSPLMMPAEAGRTYRFPSLGGDTFMGLPGMLADAVAQWPSIASSCGLSESSSKAIWSVIRP